MRVSENGEFSYSERHKITVIHNKLYHFIYIDLIKKFLVCVLKCEKTD